MQKFVSGLHDVFLFYIDVVSLAVARTALARNRWPITLLAILHKRKKAHCWRRQEEETDTNSVASFSLTVFEPCILRLHPVSIRHCLLAELFMLQRCPAVESVVGRCFVRVVKSCSRVNYGCSSGKINLLRCWTEPKTMAPQYKEEMSPSTSSFPRQRGRLHRDA